MIAGTHEKNYYEILEIAHNSSPKEIHDGHIRAKNAYNHDSLALYSLMSKDECQQMLNLIDEAYTILSDPKKRKQYDEARGINTEMSSIQRQGVGEAANSTSEKFVKHETPSITQNNMTRIVAKKKFELNYEIKPEFENEIEQTIEFSGEFLKSVREYKNVDINRMSELTRISKTYLGNIENEEYDKLPAEVYVRGFVFQYAKCLKLNPETVARSYLNRLKANNA